MSLHLEDKIARRSWDAIPMPETVISRVNELAKGEPYNFIFIDRKCRIIGYSDITVLDTSLNQEPPQTQLLDDIEVTPYI